MFQLMPGARSSRPRLNRRDLMRISAMGALGTGMSQSILAGQSDIGTTASAKNCIYIFLCGGPSQIDMWDPKPDAPEHIRGDFKPINTNVPGIQIGDLLPHTATHADKFTIIRSMHHDTQSHEPGILRTLLADKQQLNKPFPASPSDKPGIGAILSYLYGAQGQLPPWVVLPRYFMTGDHFYKGQTAGFLGNQYDAFDVNAAKKNSLHRTEFNLENLDLSKSGQDINRLAQRKELLDAIGKQGLSSSNTVRTLDGLIDRAYELFTSEKIKQVFDVKKENTATRERYGMNEYGQSFLLARRLVEADVRMVNLFWTFYGKDGCQFNLWDNHGSNEVEICGGVNLGKDMLRHDYCCPSFDKAYSALLEDLDQRGLLESTLVVVVGEFGRTPVINKSAGRDHWCGVYSAVLAGGGVKGGNIYGESDNIGGYVKDMPATPYDLHATVLKAMGVAPETGIPDQTGRPVRVTDGQPIDAIFG